MCDNFALKDWNNLGAKLTESAQTIEGNEMATSALKTLELNDVETATEAQAMTLLPLAHTKLTELMAQRNISSHGLRVFVSGGGCSGLQYGMAFEAAPRDFDLVVHQDGVRLFIDPTSMMYLSGATIDYVENLMGGGFKIENPNAASACGCGSSFKTTDSGGASDEECGCGEGCSCGR